MSKNTTSSDKTCLMHGPGHSPEECKVLKEYSKKYTPHQPHKDTEARSSGRKNVIRL